MLSEQQIKVSSFDVGTVHENFRRYLEDNGIRPVFRPPVIFEKISSLPD